MNANIVIYNRINRLLAFAICRQKCKSVILVDYKLANNKLVFTLRTETANKIVCDYLAKEAMKNR